MWLDQTGRSVPSLDAVRTRIRGVRDILSELERDGRDTDEIQLALMDHDLQLAERLATEARGAAQAGLVARGEPGDRRPHLPRL